MADQKQMVIVFREGVSQKRIDEIRDIVTEKWLASHVVDGLEAWPVEVILVSDLIITPEDMDNLAEGLEGF